MGYRTFPRGQIPALRDVADDAENPVELFESGAILMYLADRYGKEGDEGGGRRLEVFGERGRRGMLPMPLNLRTTLLDP